MDYNRCSLRGRQGKGHSNRRKYKKIVGRANVKGVPDSEKYTVEKIIVHKDWKKKDESAGLKGHNIALLHLAKPRTFPPGEVQPLRVADAGFVYPYGGKGITIGWGVAGKLGTVSHLKEFEFPLHHPLKASQLSFDKFNAPKPKPGGVIAIDQLIGVAGGDSNYSKGIYGLWHVLP